jgi:hypothetical protein
MGSLLLYESSLMATIEDILNAMRGKGYVDGSTWLQQPQMQADGPPMPTPQNGGSPLSGVMPTGGGDIRQMVNATGMRNIGAPILQAGMQPANLGQVVPNAQPAAAQAMTAPAQTGGMIGWRGLAPRYLRDLQPNAPQMGNNQVVASNGFYPFNGRY